MKRGAAFNCVMDGRLLGFRSRQAAMISSKTPSSFGTSMLVTL